MHYHAAVGVLHVECVSVVGHDDVRFSHNLPQLHDEFFIVVLVPGPRLILHLPLPRRKVRKGIHFHLWGVNPLNGKTEHVALLFEFYYVLFVLSPYPAQVGSRLNIKECYLRLLG